MNSAGAKTVLIVEDEGLIAARLHDMLIRAGYKPLTPVRSGEDALNAVAANPPDLILMDIKLSGAMNGTAAASWIRRSFDIPIVYLTAYSTPDQLEHAKISSPYGYLIKPVSERDLLVTLEMALHRHALDRRLKLSEERLGLALWGADLSLWDWDISTGILTCSGPWIERIGWTNEALKLPYRVWERHIHPQDLLEVRKLLSVHLQGDSPFWEAEYRWRVQEAAGWNWTLTRGKVTQRDSQNRPLRVCGVIMDISDRKRLEAELWRLATTDVLTGAFNRRHLLEAMETETHRTRRHARPLSFIMFDLDHFKRINDMFGHGRGDAVLVEVAKLVQERIRQSDLFARWGGEEFIVLTPETSLSQALTLAETLRSGLHQLVVEEINGITASFGVTEYRPNETLDDCLKRVDDLVYQAKNNGRDHICHDLETHPD